MRGLVVASLCAAACGAEPRPVAARPEPEAQLGAPVGSRSSAAAPGSTATAREACIVVQGDFAGQPATVEGVLLLAKNAGTKAAAAPFVLHLTRPRCTVGLARASIVTEVAVATTGADLRPLLDQRVRITGDVLGGSNDMGGPALVVLAKDITRVAPAEAQ